MTNLTDSEIVFSHIHTNPEAFLAALETVPPETKESVLAYMQTLPEIGSEEPEKITPSKEQNDQSNARET